jgi:hypothetical protein
MSDWRPMECVGLVFTVLIALGTLVWLGAWYRSMRLELRDSRRVLELQRKLVESLMKECNALHVEIATFKNRKQFFSKPS